LLWKLFYNKNEEKDIFIMSHEIIEITGGSTSKVKRKESLEDKRQWEYGIIGTAHQSSTDLTNNPPKSVNDKLGELEAKFKSHPQRHYPQWPEATLRTITPSRDSLPKVTQSYGATERIIANGRSILDKLGEPDHHVASHLNQEERQNIAFLVSLANDQYGKGYRGKAKKSK